jgi:hypothetical protein
MPISEFAEILIAQTGTWLRGGEYTALRFLGPSSSLRGGDLRTIDFERIECPACGKRFVLEAG